MHNCIKLALMPVRVYSQCYVYKQLAGDKFSHYLAYPIIILKVLIEHKMAGGRYLYLYTCID